MKRELLIIVLSIFFISSIFAQTPRRQILPDEINKIENLSPTQPTVKPSKLHNVLIFEKTTGWKSPGIEFVDSALVILGRKTNAYKISMISDDSSIFTKEKLSQFDAIVLNNTNTLKLDYDQSTALQEFVKEGKGIFALGSAISIQNWLEHAEMLGGYCFFHPFQRDRTNSENIWATKLDHPSHPLTKMFDSEGIRCKETMYQIIGPYSRKDMCILMSLDMDDIQVKNMRGFRRFTGINIYREDKDFAVTWIKEYGLGRIFNNQYSHVNPDIVFDKAFLQHFLDAMQFVLGDLKVDMTPIPISKNNQTSKKKSTKTLEEYLVQLKDKEIVNRVEAVYELGNYNSKSEIIIPALIESFNDKASDVRYFAAMSLGKFGKKAIPAVSNLLTSDRIELKEAAITSLGFIGTEADNYLNEVIKFVQSNDQVLKLEAISNIGYIAKNKNLVVPILVEALNDSLPIVRWTAVEALVTMGPDAKDALPAITNLILYEKESRPRRSASDACITMMKLPETKQAILAMTSLLEAENWQITMRAIANFGKIGKYAEPAIPKLIALTEANRPETRAFTAQALGENASFPKESVPALKKLLNDKDKDVRHTAAYALSKMGEYALPVYKEMLSNEDWYIRLKACHGLENIGSKAKPALAELRILINDKDQEVRRAVVKCIAVLEK